MYEIQRHGHVAPDDVQPYFSEVKKRCFEVSFLGGPNIFCLEVLRGSTLSST